MERETILKIATVLGLAATIGLAIYVWLPMAPPRFLPGFTDTMQLYGFNVDGSAAGPFYNPYAAMPSLHTGWAIGQRPA